MRIAYVALHLQQKYIFGGLGNKIESQIKHLIAAGNEVHFFLHTPDDLKPSYGTAYRYQARTAIAPVRKFQLEWSRSKALNRLIEAVQNYQPEIIYLRYGMFCLPLQELYKIAPVVVEINTNDLAEYRTRGPFFYTLNKLTRGFILGPAAGLVCIGQEISRLPDVIKFQKPIVVISNGIDLDRFQPLPAPANERPHLVFVAVPGHPWNGVDLLVEFGNNCPEIEIDIIGYRADEVDGKVNSNVHCHGFIKRDEVRNYLQQADCAIGTVALFRKNMQETSAIKICEYLALGIPVILPYEDTNLTRVELDTILRIPNRADNLKTHAEAVRDFVYRMRGRRVLREQAAPLIDQKIKERQRLDFFNQILAGR